jgi:hypothetical protein
VTWSKFGDNFNDRADFAPMSRSARLLVIELILWSNAQLTDGEIPRFMLRRITDSETIEADLKECLETGIVQEHGEAYQVDWSDQLSKDQILSNRKATAERQDRYRRHKADDHSLCDYCQAIKLAHVRGDHALCKPGHCNGVSNGVTHSVNNAVSNSVSNVPPSRPVPSRPGGTGKGKEKGQQRGPSGSSPASAGATPLAGLQAADTHGANGPRGRILTPPPGGPIIMTGTE